MKTLGVMEMGSRDGFAIRQQALETLEKSTKTLEVAYELLKQGNETEAKRLRNEARSQRTLSTILMTTADRLMVDPKTVRPRRYSDSFNLPSRMELP